MNEFYRKFATLSPERRALLEQKLAAQGLKASADAPITRRRTGEGDLPLSFAQQRLWFMQRFEPDNAAYNMKIALRLKGPFDRAALDHAFAQLIARHEPLRTRIVQGPDSLPRQIIDEAGDVAIDYLDLAGTEDAEVAARTRIEAVTGTPFDLSGSPLRAVLIRLARDEHLLAIGLHHIAGDRWSLGIFTHDLAALYAAGADHAAPLPEPDVHYADWALWQHEMMQGPLLQRQLDYWRDRLTGDLPVLDLPLDRPRGAEARTAGAHYPFTLDRALAKRLRALASRNNVSLFTVMLAGVKVLLHLYTDSDDIVVGSEVANRDRPETQAMMGPLVNTLVLRSDLSGDPDFTSVLRHVDAVMRGGLAHQDIPFERVVEAVNPERSLAEMTPLFQVKFDLQHRNAASPAFGEAVSEIYPLRETTTKYELRFNLEDADPDLGGRMEYSTDLFDESTVAALVRRYVRVLAALTENPERRLGAFSLLDGEEEAAIVAASAGPALDPGDTRRMHDLFEAQVEARPQAPAVTDGDTTLTYGELGALADRIAQGLVAAGAGPEQRIGLCMARTPRLVATMLGILKAGAAYVPLDPDYPADRLSFIARDADLSALVCEPQVLPAGVGEGFRILHAEDLATGEPPSDRAEALAPADDAVTADGLAYVIYTSGSTGRPKGVAIEHRNACARLEWATRHYSAEDLACVLASTSVCFDLSIFEIFAPLSAGGQVVLVDNALALPKLGDAVGVTLVNTVPSLLRELLRHHRLPASVRAVNLAGEPFPPALLATLHRDYPQLRIHNLYGPSEDTTYSTAMELGTGADREGEAGVPIGRPLPGTCAYVLDRAGRLRPDGLPGELYLGGAGVTRCYLARPGQSAERFLPDPHSAVPGARLYRTGDRVRRRPDGNLDYLGRLDHQVKIRGFRIETGEIEHHLERLAGVAEAAVVVVGDEASPDRHLAAYVAGTVPDTLEAAALRDELARHLPAHLVPGLWRVVDRLPHLPNGKVDRTALPRIETESDGGRHLAPRTGTEERIAAIWREVLARDEIGVTDSFFELGGHSLLAIRIVAKIEDAFGVCLPLKALFEAPTVAGLAARLDELRARTDESEAPAPERPEARRPEPVPDPAARYEPFPLTDIQQAYWVGRNQGFELGSVGSHGYREFDIDDLDLAAFQSALRKIIARHDMLRAVIDGDGRQRVLREVPDYTIEVTDLRDREDGEAALAAIRSRLSHQLFSPERWPLFHIEAARLDERTTRLFFGFDVLIGDGWSFRLILRELAAVMAGTQLPAIDLTFRDCVLAEEAYRQTPAFERAWRHWMKRLDTLPPAPELPLARAPAQVERPHFTRRRSGLTASQWSAFKAHAGRFGLTPTSAVMAAFAEVLARWSRRRTFTLNLTLFNREPVHPQIEAIVGDFTASLLLGLDLAGPMAFGARAQRLQARLLEDLDHRAVSGVSVLRELTRRQKRAGGALMPVVFTSVLNRSAEAATRPLNARLVDSVSQTPQVYLDHQASEDDGALVVNWDAVEDVFPEGLLDAMFAAYERFLQQLAGNAEAWNAVADLADAAPFEALNKAARLPLAGARELLHAPVFRQAEKTPERVAILCGETRLTYADVAGRAGALAAALQGAGAGRNELVVVSLEKGPDQIIACLAVLAAGAAYVPVDPDLPRERRRQLVDDTGARFVISVGTDWPQGIQRFDVPVASGAAPRPVEAAPTDLAYVIFTSGSTGRPKGVMIDHRGAVNTILDINRRFDVSAQDRVFALSSLSFDLSVYDIFGPLSVGGAVVMPRPDEVRDTACWPDLLCRHQVTVWNSVPALAQLLCGELGAAPAMPDLRLVMMSGDWIPLDLPDALRAHLRDAHVVSLGGATEASIWSVFHPVGGRAADWSSVPYGTPLANQSWYVLDDDGRPCPPWVPGRLFIGGTGVARGYWGRPELTAERFVPDPFADPETVQAGALHLYETGDLGRLRLEGVLEFLGREDFQVKINGYRVELGEIEAIALRHPGVAEAVASTFGSPPSLVLHMVPALSTEGAAEKLELRGGQAGLRADVPGARRIALPDAPPADAALIARQSHRRFLPGPVPLERIARLLQALRAEHLPGAPLAKYAYPSAGGLYPVFTCLHVSGADANGGTGVRGLEPGWYYHQRERNELVALPAAEAGALESALAVNRDLARDGAFGLYLVANIAAVEEVYGDRARDFCLLEAGHMGQVLMNAAPALDLGLCAMGGVDHTAIDGALALEPGVHSLYALCGGAIDPAWSESWQAIGPQESRSLAEQVRAFLADHLPAYMVPRDILQIDRLPLSANGKVDRQALPQPGLRERRAVPPATALEERILTAWRDLLDAPDIGVEDNFFEAGGNSLTAMQLLARLRQSFGVELTIAQFFAALTPRAQAALVDAAHPVSDGAAAAPIPVLSREPALSREEETAEALTDAEVDAMLARLGGQVQEDTP